MGELKLENEVKFDDKEISNMKYIIDANDLISDDEKKEIKRIIALSIKQDYGLAILFIKCHDYLLNLCEYLVSGEADHREKILKFLEFYSHKYKLNDLREIVQRINRIDGGIGTFHLQRNLVREVQYARKDYLDLVKLFSKISGVEE